MTQRAPRRVGFGAWPAGWAARARRGFSSLEILIVVIILGILAALIVPTLQNRSRDARIRAANRDIRELVEAETRCAIDSRFYVPLHILDDVVIDPSVASTWNHDRADAINLELSNPNVVAGRTTRIFIDPKTGDFLDPATSNNYYLRMIGAEGTSNPTYEQILRALERFTFRPPYLSWNRDYDRDDMQEDPWGNPYLFFTQLGLVYDYNTPKSLGGQIQHTIETGRWVFPPLTDNLASPLDCGNIFDRCVILSMGPDGVPGPDDAGSNIFGTGDDIFTYFN